MRIQHNIAALNSFRNLTNNNSAVSKNLEKLSSGYRINRAGDDAAGLAISEKMRAQITGLETAQKNASDGVSLVQTAEGALTEVHSMLNRMVELADQSANGTYKNEVDRENLQAEMESLQSEIDRISKATNFNGINLLDGSLNNANSATMIFGSTEIGLSAGAGFTGTVQIKGDNGIDGIKVDVTNPDAIKISLSSKAQSSYTSEQITQAVRDAAQKALNEGGDAGKLGALLSFEASFSGPITLAASDATDKTSGNLAAVPGKTGGLSLQIGDTADNFNQLTVQVGAMNTAALGIDKVDISTQDGAKAAVETLKDAINKVSSTRGDLGAIQNRLEHTINNLSVTSENMTAAESRIRDVDMAKEMMAYTKNNILVQSSQAMLAQANQVPQGVLQLLQ